MPKRSQLPVICPRKTVAQHPQTPFTLETVRRTVLKLANPLGCHQPSAPDLSEAALVAMQRLVEIINTLRSSQPSFLEHLSPQSPGAIELLLPYVTEEAYDVLDTLRSEDAASGQPSASRSWESGVKSREPHLTTFPDPHIHASTHPLVAIETLIPALLWRIARSDYSLMRLIEGVRGRCYQPQGWATGMLRLVVMLDLEAPTVRWCFDLATGQAAAGLLEPIAIVQMDEPVLSMPQTAHAGAAVSDAFSQVEHQLRAVLHLLHSTVGLEDFLQGMTVALLKPGSDWQTGELRLRFGFEFSAQASDAASHEAAPGHTEPIDAELMDDSAGITPQRPQRLATPLNATIARSMATAQVSAVNPLGRSLSPATLLRASDPALLERYIQQTNRQQVAQSLCRLHRQASHVDESGQLAIIVQAALDTPTRQTSVVGIGLLQPTLLLDELAPKLLWSLTRCTDEMMQLLGGLPAQMLQPGANWQQGTLRLLAGLQITAANLDYTLDLSTGRSVAVNAAQLAGAIVQSSATALCPQPMPIETLTASLQQLWDGAPESKFLVDGLAVDWLEDVEQDWQTGTITLKLSLSFLPDAC